MELGSRGEMRARLNALVLAGTKQGTAGLFAEYAQEDEQLERPGEVMVLVGDDLEEVARIRVTAVDVVPFAEVSDEFARSEGEGFADRREWAAAHRAFWTAQAATITEATLVACIGFRLVDGDI